MANRGEYECLGTRSFDDVWEEIVAKAREFMTTREAIATRMNGVRNVIVRVDERGIERMSEQSLSGRSERIPRAEFGRLWNRLCQEGQTGPAGHVFGVQLMARFVDGVTWYPGNRIVLEDREAASVPFASRRRAGS